MTLTFSDLRCILVPSRSWALASLQGLCGSTVFLIIYDSLWQPRCLTGGSLERLPRAYR